MVQIYWLDVESAAACMVSGQHEEVCHHLSSDCIKKLTLSSSLSRFIVFMFSFFRILLFLICKE